MIVYSDANRSNLFDAAERWTRTAADESYTLDGLPAGNDSASAPLRVEGPAGWRQTAPGGSAGTTSASPPFMHVSGRLCCDRNANGTRDAGDHGLSG